MNVIATGKNSFKRELIEAQVLWTIHELGIKNSRLNLEIIPKPGLRMTHLSNGLSGRMGDLVGLVIDTQIPIPQLFATVAHEMIHIKQYARGQLVYEMKGDKEIAYWCGKRMKNIPYFERPWEIEAFGKQEILARRFNDVLNGVMENGNSKRKVRSLQKKVR